MSWPPETFLRHPGLPWTLDATVMGLDPAALDALPWERAFDEMEALERGAIANPDEDRQVGHYWLRAPELAPTMGQARAIGDTLTRLQAFARQVRRGEIASEDGRRFGDVLHVGIGGSALGPQLLLDALAERGLRVHVLDNTDPDGIARVLARLGDRLKTTLVIVATKSGTTPETMNALALVEDALRAAGLDAPPRLIAITCAGSALDARANAERWLASFPLWDWVGGRCSATSAVGLLPAALAGVDTSEVLRGAREMDDWTRSRDWRTNPAALLAGAWHLEGHGRGDRAMVVIPYADRLARLAHYLQQLVMESLGKRLDRRGRPVFQGLTVYGNKGSTDQHAYVQQLRDGRHDFFALFVQRLGDDKGSALEVADGVNAGDHLQGFLLGTRRALADEGRHSMTLTVPAVDARIVGGLIALFERAVGLYGSLVDLNAYHQPGVEAGKKAAKVLLDRSRALRARLAAGPADVPTLAAAVGGDPMETLYLLERLAETGRVVRTGNAPTATYALPAEEAP